MHRRNGETETSRAGSCGRTRRAEICDSGGVRCCSICNEFRRVVQMASDAGAIEVHRTLGPGLLESIYAPCLHAELAARQLRFVTQRAVQIVYKGMPLEASYRVDLIVEDLVVELKSTSALLPVHQAQVLTYLEITKCPAGLLINFNVPRLMDGVKRLINPRATRRRGEPDRGETDGPEPDRAEP